MRMIGAEIKKIWQNRPFLVIICFCILMNIFYLCIQMTPGVGINHKYSEYEGFLHGAWKNDMEITSGLNTEKKREWFEEQSTLANYLLAEEKGFDTVMERIEQDFSSWDDAEWKENIEQIKNAADGISMNGIRQRYDHYVSRIDYIESYPEFLETVKKRAESMKGISLFSKPDSFSQQHILNTAEQFKKLDNLQLGIEYSPSYEVATFSTLTDVMSLIIVWVTAWIVFFQEQSKGLSKMLKSTKNGQINLVLTKMLTYMLTIVFCGLLLYATQMLFAYCLYGTGGENLALQSIESFRNSVWNCSIGEYVNSFLLIKLFAIIVIGSIMMVILCNSTSLKMTTIILFVILGIEWLCYQSISVSSRWNVFKYMNIFYLQDVEEQAKAYVDVNIMSKAIPAGSMICYLGLVLVITSIIVTIIASLRKKEKTVHISVLTYIMDFIRKKIRGCHCTTSIYIQEAGKLYKNCHACLIIVALVIFSRKNANGILQYQLTSNRNVYQDYIQKYQGYYTDEKSNLLMEDQAYFQLEDQESIDVNKKWQNGQISEEEYNQWQKERQWGIQARQDGFKDFYEQAQIVEQASYKTEKAGFVDKYQFSYLMEDDGRQAIMAIVLLLSVCICSCKLFGMEYTTGVKPLINSTPNGRNRLLKIKILQLLGASTIFFLILYLPYDWMIITQIERVPFEMALMSVPSYASLNIPLEIGQAFVMTIVIRYITTICVMILSVVITNLIKHTIFSIAICLLLFVLPCFLLFVGVDLTLFTCAGGMLFERVLRSF